MSSVAFIQQLYSRFLGRPADEAGVRYWTQVLDTGLANAAQLTHQFLSSAEFRQAVEPVARLYFAAFGRIPDAAGLAYWVERAQAGTALDEIAKAFAASAEFTDRYSALGTADFLNKLYQTALGRAIDSAGADWWTRAIESGGMSRVDVLRALADSTEMQQAKSAAIHVVALYHGTTGAAPTWQDIDATLAQGDPLAQITALYADSTYTGASVPGLIVRGTTLAHGTVFIDLNGNRALDAGETSAQADLDGHYSFEGQATFTGQLVEVPLQGQGSGGGGIILDVIAPVISSSNPVAGQTNVPTNTLTFTFNESVQKGSGTITLTDGVSQYVLNGGVLTHRVVGASDTRAIPVGDAAITVSGNTMTINVPGGLKANTSYSVVIGKGAIIDMSGNPYAGITDTTLLRFTTGVATDLTPPYAVSASYSQGGFYNAGDVIEFTVHFDQAVVVNGTPVLDLETGATDRQAQYVSGSGTSELVFRYTVQAGDVGNFLNLKVDNGVVGYGLAGQVRDLSNNVLDQAHIQFSSLTYAGNGYGTSTITVDTEAPAAPTTFSLATYDDTGDSATDGKTQSLAPHFKGVAEPYATVNVYKNTTLVASGTADSSGNYTIANTTSFGKGNHTFYAYQTDRAGNVSSSYATLGIEIDNTTATKPNALTLADASDSGTKGDGATDHTIVTLEGSGALPNRQVWIVEDGVKIAAFQADSSGNYSGSLAFANGVHALTAINQDLFGNQSLPSDVFNLTVVSAGPSAPALHYDDNTGLTEDNLTKDTTPRITGIAQPGSTISLMKENGASDMLLGTTTVPASGVWTIGGVTFAEGATQVYIEETDVSHQTYISSTSTIRVDTVAPAAADAPDLDDDYDTGASHTDNITTHSHMRLFGDAGSAEAGSAIEVFAGSESLGYTLVDEDGSWELYVDLAPQVTPYALTAVVTDAAGNVGPASAVLSVTVLEAPSAPSSAPSLVAEYDTGISASDGYTSLGSVKLTGSGATPNGTVNIYNNYEVKIGTAVANGSGVWVSDLINVGEGYHYITVRGVDGNGIESEDESDEFELHVSDDKPYISVDSVSADTGPYNYDWETSDTTPTIVGYADHGSTVHVKVNGTEVGTTTASMVDGTWSYSLGTKGQGTYAISAYAVSLAGITGDPEDSYAPLKIDTEAPAGISAAPSLNAYSDTGISNADRLTMDSTPMFNGTGAPANLYMRLYEGSTEIGVGYVDAAGNYWAEVDDDHALTHGTHAITMKFEDLAGNLSAASDPVTITVDLEAPTTTATAASLDSGSDTGTAGDNFTRLSNPLLTGNAPAGQRVKITVDDYTSVFATANGSGIWSTSAITFGKDTYSITVAHVDDAGNAGPSSPAYSLQVDPASMSASIFGLVEDNGLYNYDHITSDDTPTLSGYATDGSTVHIKIGATEVATVTASEGMWQYTLPTQGEGEKSITVFSTDTHGHTSATSSAFTLTVDTIAPATVATAPDMLPEDDTGDLDSDNVTSNTTVGITGSGAEAGAIVWIYDGATKVTETTVQAGGGWTAWLSGLSESTHSITAKFVDYAGNVSGASNALSITVDTTAPTGTASAASLSSASDTGTLGDGITKTSSPTLTGSATSGQIVYVYVNGTLQGAAVAGAGNTWSLPAGLISSTGSYAVTVKLADLAGNVGPASTSYTVQLDEDVPEVAISGLLDDSGDSGSDEVTSDNTPRVNGTATTGDTVHVLIDGTEVGTTVASGGTWSYTLPSKVDGDYTISAFATDTAGNQSATTSDLEITIDTTNPATMSAASIVLDNDTGEVTDDNITNTTSPLSFSGSGFAADTDVEIYVGATKIGSGTVNGSGALSAATDTALTHGSHTLLFYLIDLAGNKSDAATYTVNVDRNAPSTGTFAVFDDDSIATPIDDTDSTIQDQTPTFHGSGLEIGDTVELYVNGGVVDSTTISVGGNWTLSGGSFSDSGNTPESAYIVVTDLAGNSSTSSTLSFTIDTGETEEIPAPDTTAPTITSSETEDTTLSLTFNETIQFDSDGQIRFYDNNDALTFTLYASDTQYYTISGNTIVFHDLFSQLPLIPGGYSYTIDLNSAIEDLSDNACTQYLGDDSGLTWRPIG